MDTGSVISFLINDLIFSPSKEPDRQAGLKVFVPDRTKKINDKSSVIEFIRETYDLPSRGRRKYAREITQRETGIQMIELVQGYVDVDPRADNRDPYYKVSVSDVLDSDSIIPIFDVSRVFQVNDSAKERAKKYAGYLRNVRDAFTAMKFVNSFEDYSTAYKMYRDAMQTLVPAKNAIVPVPVSRRHVGDLGHVIFRDVNDGRMLMRRRPAEDSAVIEPDESLISNVLGTKHGVNTIASGKRRVLSDPVSYGFSGFYIEDAKPGSSKTFNLPKETEKMLANILKKKSQYTFFTADSNAAADASIRGLISAGLEPIVEDPIGSYRDYVFAKNSRRISGSLSPRDVEKTIAKSIRKPKPARLGKRKSSDTVLNVSSIESPIDDFVREIFYQIRRRQNRFPEASEAAMIDLIKESANFLGGKYYSKFTGNELEFFSPIESDMTGMSFDEEFAFLGANFNEDDYVSYAEYFSFEGAVRRVEDVTGGLEVFRGAMDIVAENPGPAPDPSTYQKISQDRTGPKFPETNNTRFTRTQDLRYPNDKASSFQTEDQGTRHSSAIDLSIDDATGLVEFASSIKSFRDLKGPDGENLLDERKSKLRIIDVFDLYTQKTGIDVDSLIEKYSGVPGADFGSSVFKIGTFDSVSDMYGVEYSLAKSMNETWRFCTAVRQALCTLWNEDFTDVDEDSEFFELMPDMHRDAYEARKVSGLRKIPLELIFGRLKLGDIPTVSALSDAFPNEILSTDADFRIATKKSRGIALLYIEKTFRVIYDSVLGHKLPESTVRSILGSIQRSFISVLAEEIGIRNYTDIAEQDARWVFQELYTEWHIQMREHDDSLLEIDESSLDDDETLEDAEESWALHDSIGLEISELMSEWDDID